MSGSPRTSPSVRRTGHHTKQPIRPKRIADVVGLHILSEEDWKETRRDLDKATKDSLRRLEKSY